MIEGIEILSKTEIMTSPDWLVWAAIFGAFGIVLIGFVVSILFQADDRPSAFITGLIALAYAIIMVGVFSNSEPTGRYKYEATIDETVNFTELYERYDVVDQRGQIYILEDKNTEV